MIKDILQGRERSLFTIALLFVVFVLVVSTAYYIIFLDSWFDETNYGYKAWLVGENLALPFIDFGTKYPTVALYSQALWQNMFGPSTFAARVLSGIFLIGMGALIFDILRRHGGRWLALIGLSLFVFHPFTIGKLAAATPNAMIGFFALLSIWFLFTERISLERRILFSSFAMSIAFLVRYNYLPALIILWAFVLIKWRSPKLFAISVASSLGTIAFLSAPYILIDFEYAASFFMAMFGPLAALFPLDFFSLGGGGVQSYPSLFNFFFNEGRLKLIMGVLTTYFHIWAIILFGLVFIFATWKRGIIEFFREHSFFVLNFVILVAMFLAHFFFGPNRHKGNLLYFLPFMILTASYVGHMVYTYLNENGSWEASKRVIASAVIAMIILVPFSIAISGNDVIFFNRFDYADSDLSRVKRGADYLSAVTTINDVLLTIDNPDHVFGAGRYMIPARINRHDTYSDIEDVTLLDRFSRYNTAMFLDWLRDDVTVFVFQRGTFLERLLPIAGGTDIVALVENILEQQYELVGSIEDVYPRKDERSGIMDVYRKIHDE